MRNIRILVITRPSVSHKIAYSRSVYSRLIEPLDLLKNYPNFEVIFCNELEALESRAYESTQFVIFSKQKSLAGLNLLAEAKASQNKVIYDIDELIFEYPSYSTIDISHNEKAIFLEFLAKSDFVTVSTRRLADALQSYVAREYHIIPTGFNFDSIEPKTIANPPAKSFEILFVNGDTLKLGPASNEFIRALNDFLVLNRENATLTIISDTEVQLAKDAVVNFMGAMDWHEYRKFMLCNSFSLAIVPLGGEEEPENLLYNSCKTPIKFIEYGGYCLAGLYSDTPLYSDIVTLANGFLTRNTYNDWLCALERCFNQRNTLPDIGNSAQETVRENFSIRYVLDLWNALLTGANS